MFTASSQAPHKDFPPGHTESLWVPQDKDTQGSWPAWPRPAQSTARCQSLEAPPRYAQPTLPRLHTAPVAAPRGPNKHPACVSAPTPRAATSCLPPSNKRRSAGSWEPKPEVPGTVTEWGVHLGLGIRLCGEPCSSRAPRPAGPSCSPVSAPQEPAGAVAARSSHDDAPDPPPFRRFTRRP